MRATETKKSSNSARLLTGLNSRRPMSLSPEHHNQHAENQRLAQKFRKSLLLTNNLDLHVREEFDIHRSRRELRLIVTTLSNTSTTRLGASTARRRVR